jgi:hypothetical protein
MQKQCRYIRFRTGSLYERIINYSFHWYIVIYKKEKFYTNVILFVFIYFCFYFILNTNLYSPTVDTLQRDDIYQRKYSEYNKHHVAFKNTF